MKLFSGLITINTDDAPRNNFFTLFAENEDEAMGKMIRAAREDHPKGSIITTYVYEIDKETIERAAREYGVTK